MLFLIFLTIYYFWFKHKIGKQIIIHFFPFAFANKWMNERTSEWMNMQIIFLNYIYKGFKNGVTLKQHCVNTRPIAFSFGYKNKRTRFAWSVMRGGFLHWQTKRVGKMSSMKVWRVFFFFFCRVFHRLLLACRFIINHSNAEPALTPWVFKWLNSNPVSDESTQQKVFLRSMNKIDFIIILDWIMCHF